MEATGLIPFIPLAGPGATALESMPSRLLRPDGRSTVESNHAGLFRHAGGEILYMFQLTIEALGLAQHGQIQLTVRLRLKII